MGPPNKKNTKKIRAGKILEATTTNIKRRRMEQTCGKKNKNKLCGVINKAFIDVSQKDL